MVWYGFIAICENDNNYPTATNTNRKKPYQNHEKIKESIKCSKKKMKKRQERKFSLL